MVYVSLISETYAQKNPSNILVSIGDTKNFNSDFKKSTCEQIYLLSNQIIQNGSNVTCRLIPKDDFMDSGLAKLRPKFDYHLRIIKSNDQSVHVDISNWKNINDDADFKTLGWKIKITKDDETRFNESLTKIAINIFTYIDNEEDYKTALLIHGIKESDSISFDEKSGKFIDQLTYEPVTNEKAFKYYAAESERKRNYLRTGIEIGVLLSTAEVLYFKNLVYNSVDFDYTLSSGLKKKLNGEAILYDDNDKFANIGHAFAGVLYHQTARANGFKPLEAFLIDIATSTVWEFLEYQEVLSINDEIITGVGGYVIGEALFQTSCALMGKGGVVNTVIGGALSPALGGNALFGGKKALPEDCKKERWSKISAYVGLEKGQKAYDPSKYQTKRYGFSSEVINIPGYNGEGQGHGLMVDTALSKILIENNQMNDVKLIAQVASAAYYQRKMTTNSQGNLEGYDFALALTHGFNYEDTGTTKDLKNEDFVGTVNLVGATVHVNLNHNGFNIRAEIGFSGDFAMVKSYALTPYENSVGNLDNLPSVVRKHGYYWGYGTSTTASMAVSRGRFEVGAKYRNTEIESVKSRNRLGNDGQSTFNDSSMSGEFYITFSVTKHVAVKLSHEIIERSGTLNDNFLTSGAEKRTTGTLIYLF